MNNINNIMDIFENTINYIRNIIRKNGVTGMDSIHHCILFILCKYLTNEKCNVLKINNKYSFENLIIDENGNDITDPNRIMEKFTRGKDSFIGQIKEIFQFKIDFKIDNIKDLKSILHRLKDINIEKLDLNFDIIGTIYELHLKTGSNNSRDLG